MRKITRESSAPFCAVDEVTNFGCAKFVVPNEVGDLSDVTRASINNWTDWDGRLP